MTNDGLLHLFPAKKALKAYVDALATHGQYGEVDQQSARRLINDLLDYIINNEEDEYGPTH